MVPRNECAACAGPLGQDQYACHFCGTPTDLCRSTDDERRAWIEGRQALAEAVRTAGLQGGSEVVVRARFLRNMPIPRTTDLLIDDVFECQRVLSDDIGADNAAPELRYQSCLNRLELLAVDDPALQPKLKTLSRQLERHRGRVRRSNTVFGIIALVVVAAAIALLVLIGRGLILLFR